MKPHKRHDILMALIVVPCALLGAIILIIGARDIESRRVEKNTQCVDSIRNDYRTTPKHLETLGDSIHEFEDGF